MWSSLPLCGRRDGPDPLSTRDVQEVVRGDPSFCKWGFHPCSLNKAFLCVKSVMHMGFEPMTFCCVWAFLKQAVDVLKWAHHAEWCRLGSLRGGLWDSVADFIQLILFFRVYAWGRHCWKGVRARQEAGHVGREVEAQCRSDGCLSDSVGSSGAWVLLSHPPRWAITWGPPTKGITLVETFSSKRQQGSGQHMPGSSAVSSSHLWTSVLVNCTDEERMIDPRYGDNDVYPIS